MKSQEFTNYLTTLRKKLPKGAIGKIASTLHVHRTTISKVFSGEIINEAVINEAIRLVEEEKASKQQLAERIKAL
ncbi:MAG: hypothetical protein QHC79_09745 [Pseudosphingobacterium sp.]|nr:hypothetical protein [Pseudosphingobacterium sp.]